MPLFAVGMMVVIGTLAVLVFILGLEIYACNRMKSW